MLEDIRIIFPVSHSSYFTLDFTYVPKTLKQTDSLTNIVMALYLINLIVTDKEN